MSVTREEALDAIVKASEADDDEGKSGELLGAASQAVEIIGRRKYFDLRDTWSKWIIGWITVLIAFDSIVTVAVGLGCLDYSQYEGFITVVFLQTFLQIVGLGAVAVRYLFKSN